MTECVKPDVEELYLVAANASDLSVQTERRGPADLLIAAGWSQSRLGAAALRLHSEWSAAALPRRPDRAMIELIANDMRRCNGRLDMAKASAFAAEWYSRELLQVCARLHSLPVVREQLAAQARLRGMDDPEPLASEVLRHWLDPVCPACHGLKFKPVKGAPVLSVKVCPACHGIGRTDPPRGQGGRWLLNFLDDCVSVARTSIRKRLHAVPKMV